MDQADAGNANGQGEAAPPLPGGLLGRWPWATFVLPLAVFMLVGSLEPTPPEGSATGAVAVDEADEGEGVDGSTGWFEPRGDRWLPPVRYRYYPVVYTVKIALTIVAMLLVWPGYRTFPWRLSPIAIVVGVVGAALWIGLCQLRLEPKLLGPLDRWLGDAFGMTADDLETPSVGLVGSGERSAFNPLKQLADNPAWAYGFLAIRLIGLALVVPVIEEFFLRGFLMRFVVHDQWHQVPFGAVNRLALLVGTAVPMMMHPGELLAAAAWFSLVSWLMVRTRNIWDCVVAHALTNGLLGAYVLAVDTPEAWRMM